MKVILQNTSLVFAKAKFHGTINLWSANKASGPVISFNDQCFYKVVNGVVELQTDKGSYKAFIAKTEGLSSITSIVTNESNGIGIFFISSLENMTPIKSVFIDVSWNHQGQIKTITSNDIPDSANYVVVSVLKVQDEDYGDSSTQSLVYE